MTTPSGLLRRLLHPQTRRAIFHNSITLIKFAAIVHLFGTHVGYPYRTYGPSMLPTIASTGDVVYVSKLHRRGKGIKVGDVVSFKHPMFPDTGAIKRVVGMPGDFVARDTPGRGNGVMLQVPEGHCWLIGDNVSESRDSRTFGPLPLALIKGKTVAKWGGVKTFGWIENNLVPAEVDV